MSIVEQPFDVGALVPPHLHTREDLVSVDAMWNAGKPPARIIEVMTPAGFEGAMREVAAMAAAGPPSLEAMGAVAARYGMSFEEPAWLPDVIARYDLPPPPPM